MCVCVGYIQYVSIRQHTSAFSLASNSIAVHASASACVSMRQHLRRHTSAFHVLNMRASLASNNIAVQQQTKLPAAAASNLNCTCRSSS